MIPYHYLYEYFCQAPLDIHILLKTNLFPLQAQTKMEQLRLEFMALMEEYGVERLEGLYERK